MRFIRLRPRSVSGNSRALNIFCFWFCLRFYSAVTVIYFAHVTHSYVLASSLLVLAQVTQALLQVPTGIFSDRVGRVWCLRLGALAGLLSALFYALAASYAWLALGALLEGLWKALFLGNNEALLYESARQDGRLHEFHDYLGKVNVSMEVSGFIAVIAGGLLAAASFQWALWLTVAAQLPAFVAGFALVEPRSHVLHTTNVWHHFRAAAAYMRRNPTLRKLSLVQILSNGFSTFQLWPAFYNQLVPLQAVGALLSVNYLESAIGFRTSGWFMRRFRAVSILLVSDVFSKVCMFVALLSHSPASPALMALAGSPYGPSTVAAGTLLHKEYTDHQRATLASINALLGSCLYAVFGIFSGIVADHWGVGRAILAGQICLLPTLWLHWKLTRAKDIAIDQHVVPHDA